MKYFRAEWPLRAGAPTSVDIVTVNYNTREHIAHLVFSLYRILGPDQFGRLVIVDNGSSDGSTELLRELANAGLAQVIFNKKQRYHGPALNQAINHLAKQERKVSSARPSASAIWVLDSDTLVLRRDAVQGALAVMRSAGAAVVGELQYAELPDGYAHPCTMLLDPAKVWRRPIDVFHEEGTPARQLHISLRRKSASITSFPYRTGGYVLHLGRATLGQVATDAQIGNRYYHWASRNRSHDYHGNPDGAAIHGAFIDLYESCVPQPTGKCLVEACRRTALCELEMDQCRAECG